MWLINARMDLAHIIKGLLNTECMFRFLGCVLINSLRGAFILWGWQPSLLIQIVGVIDSMTDDQQFDDISLNQESFVSNDNISKTKLLTTKYNSSNSLLLSDANENNFSHTKLLYPSIESVCSLPSTLAVFSSYGISIFVLLTGDLLLYVPGPFLH